MKKMMLDLHYSRLFLINGENIPNFLSRDHLRKRERIPSPRKKIYMGRNSLSLFHGLQNIYAVNYFSCPGIYFHDPA